MLNAYAGNINNASKYNGDYAFGERSGILQFGIQTRDMLDAMDIIALDAGTYISAYSLAYRGDRMDRGITL